MSILFHIRQPWRYWGTYRGAERGSKFRGVGEGEAARDRHPLRPVVLLGRPLERRAVQLDVHPGVRAKPVAQPDQLDGYLPVRRVVQFQRVETVGVPPVEHVCPFARRVVFRVDERASLEAQALQGVVLDDCRDEVVAALLRQGVVVQKEHLQRLVADDRLRHDQAGAGADGIGAEVDLLHDSSSGTAHHAV
eukprot:scaffold3082_cov22-Prasinocladus_malaysianus.AAC.1